MTTTENATKATLLKQNAFDVIKKTLFLGDFGLRDFWRCIVGMHASDLFKHFQAFNSAAIMIQELYLKNIFSKYTWLMSEFRNEGFTSLIFH